MRKKISILNKKILNNNNKFIHQSNATIKFGNFGNHQQKKKKIQNCLYKIQVHVLKY